MSDRDFILRPATADDRPAIIALIDGIYRAYGDQVCLDDADKDLTLVPDYYSHRRGEFVVLVATQNRIVGTHAYLPLDDRPGVCTFRRLYLDEELRGAGWAQQLMQWAIDAAQIAGFRRVEFWSDTRFARAHRFFARLGFVRDGRIREMHDALTPYKEYFFFRDL